MSRRMELPIEEVVQRYEAGASLRELAAAYGVSATTVRDRLAGAGVQVRPRGAARLDVDVNGLVYEVHLAGSGRAAARSLGLGRATVGRRLAERTAAAGRGPGAARENAAGEGPGGRTGRLPARTSPQSAVVG